MDMPYSIPHNPPVVAYAAVVEYRDDLGRIVEKILCAFSTEELAEEFCVKHNEDETTSPHTADVRVFALLDSMPFGYAPKVRKRNEYKTKLTETDVLNIRALYQGGMTQARIAERYGVTRQMISYIVTGKLWAWL